MKFPWKREREKHEHLDQVEKLLTETDAIVVSQQPSVNSLVGWLEARRMQNGFGEDFEWTLANPRRRGNAT